MNPKIFAMKFILRMPSGNKKYAKKKDKFGHNLMSFFLGKGWE
jgi:hypothetical protein